MKKGKTHALRILKNYIFLFIGSLIAAVGIEIFLVPNNIIDARIVGISIIASHVWKISLGIFTFFLNIPFLKKRYSTLS